MAIREPYKVTVIALFLVLLTFPWERVTHFTRQERVSSATSWLARKRPLCLPGLRHHKYKLLLEIASR